MAKNKDSKKLNVCKFCNCEFQHPDKRQSFCSKECLSRRKELTRVETSCCVCGKSIVKRRSMIRDKNCCGLDCQRIWANQCSIKRTEAEKGRFEKAKWKKQQSDIRKQKSVAFIWWKKCNQKASEQKPVGLWDQKCQTASTQLLYRKWPNARKQQRKRIVPDTWNTCFYMQKMNLLSRSWYHKQDPWSRKCISVMSGTKRRLRRSHRRNKDTSKLTSEQGRQLLFWKN